MHFKAKLRKFIIRRNVQILLHKLFRLIINFHNFDMLLRTIGFHSKKSFLDMLIMWLVACPQIDLHITLLSMSTFGSTVVCLLCSTDAQIVPLPLSQPFYISFKKSNWCKSISRALCVSWREVNNGGLGTGLMSTKILLMSTFTNTPCPRSQCSLRFISLTA